MRNLWMKTGRIGFSRWQETDGELALALWGDPEVTRYIAKPGGFSPEEIRARLGVEMENERRFGVQYWPLFLLETGEFLGCCGFRPGPEGKTLELGFHLMKAAWGQGYAKEAARAALGYAGQAWPEKPIVAGRHPENLASGKVLESLGFHFMEARYYPPTGLCHPSYQFLGQQKG